MSNTPSKLFTFHHYPIRVVDINNEPWFVAADLCKALNYASILRVRSEAYPHTSEVHTTSDGEHVTIINWPGLQNMLAKHGTPRAQQFHQWVETDVLPLVYPNQVTDQTPPHVALRDVLDQIMTEAQRVVRLAPGNTSRAALLYDLACEAKNRWHRLYPEEDTAA